MRANECSRARPALEAPRRAQLDVEPVLVEERDRIRPQQRAVRRKAVLDAEAVRPPALD